mmetsp:Transcript_23809/g.62317  ORF Transcript_23809/g.62317 Transcript_23809/m.62317 type:complete len:98 (-) Transcript_23809:1120-1413(-)
MLDLAHVGSETAAANLTKMPRAEDVFQEHVTALELEWNIDIIVAVIVARIPGPKASGGPKGPPLGVRVMKPPPFGSCGLQLWMYGYFFGLLTTVWVC